MGDRVKVTIECTREQLGALSQSCETSFRIALGQFGEVAEVHSHRFKDGWSALQDDVEMACKAIIWWKLSVGVTRSHNGEPFILNYTGEPLPKVTIESTE